ncbi:hypothetical protein [Limnohabitans sp. G3-2]|uniref:hypothetical protein n=1 Tax=Limnohabitans sp. G3-2 TaxID=1100711 RepID=UPI001179EDE0|nr:hypothetical protein [Limnohabitans sp. G3-2]
MTPSNATADMVSSPPGMPTGSIPVLTTVVPEAAVSQALRAALDAQAQKKMDWMSLESDLLLALRPEMERLTTELVRVGLREAWRKHTGGMA